MQQLTFSSNAWWLLACLVLALLVAIGLYAKTAFFNEHPERKPLQFGLALLRGFVIFCIAALLLNPFFKFIQNKTERPIVAFITDQSASVFKTTNSETLAAFNQTKAQITEDLSKTFEVVEYALGEELSFAEEQDTFQATNITAGLNGVAAQFYNQNLGAIVLASDGLHNTGQAPAFAAIDKSIPVFSIGLGDTTTPKDLWIKEVQHSKIVYQGDQLELVTKIAASKLGNQNATVSVREVGKSGGTQKSFTIDKDAFITRQSLIVQPSSAGLKHYQVRVTTNAEETSKQNNYTDVFIEVIDSRKKVLILAAGPHPDVYALKQSISEKKNYAVEVQYLNKFNGELKGADVLILHQLPSVQSADLAQKLTLLKIPTLYILGSDPNINYAALNKVQSSLGIQKRSSTINEVQAAYQSNFNAFEISASTKNIFEQFPPLFAPFLDYNVTKPNSVLFGQKIGNVTTDYPLLLVDEINGQRTAFINGEGIWRWRMLNYLNAKNYVAFDEVIGKTIQYLAVEKDKRKFRANPLKRQFNTGEPVVIEAQLFNDLYEPINQPDVQLKITSNDSLVTELKMSRTAKSYKSNIGFLPAGVYQYSANCVFNQQPLSASGKFVVEPLQLESLQTKANHQLLNTLSVQTNGQFYAVENMNEISNALINSNTIKPVVYSDQENKAMIHLQLIAMILMLLLAIEWFVRKWLGLV